MNRSMQVGLQLQEQVDRLTIANAELLEALQAIMRRLPRWQKFGIEAGPKGQDWDFKELCAKIESAISKAVRP